MKNPCERCADKQTCLKRCEQYEWYIKALEDIK